MKLNKRQIIEELRALDLSGTDLQDKCPIQEFVSLESGCPAEKSYKYRTTDGRCNNLLNPSFGQAMMPFYRFLYPDYADGKYSADLNTPGIHSMKAILVITA